MYTPIGTAKLNDVDPQAWLADVLGRIAETPQSRLDELLPWDGLRSRGSIKPHRPAHPKPINPKTPSPIKLVLLTPAVFGGRIRKFENDRKNEVRRCRSSTMQMANCTTMSSI